MLAAANIIPEGGKTCRKICSTTNRASSRWRRGGATSSACWASFLIAMLLIGGSLLAGMWGYAHFEGMSWLDAFLNASMILSSMGPADQLKTNAGKLFAGCYALYSGLVIVLASGIVLAPVVHRLLHRFHVDE
jgi:hypothetical protein